MICLIQLKRQVTYFTRSYTILTVVLRTTINGVHVGHVAQYYNFTSNTFDTIGIILKCLQGIMLACRIPCQNALMAFIKLSTKRK